MRYYDLAVTDNTGRLVKRWTSHPNNVFDPAAQNIEFDMLTVAFANPAGNSALRIEGVSLDDLQQNRQFAGLNVELRAGMGKGLPLSNPKQAGVIAAGQIWQSYGNWQGTEMSLDFVITPSQHFINSPGNVILNWRKGTRLSDALLKTMNVAYPNAKTKIEISNELIADQDIIGMYASVNDLAKPIYDITKHMGHPVNLYYQPGHFIAFDDTYSPTPIPIEFTDLVGQPTWIDVNIMQLKVVLRADITVGSIIKMPKGFQNQPGLVVTTQQAMPAQLKYKSAFTGNFSVNEVRQIGNYRTADGGSWVTVLNCVAGA